ncbi:het domain-containing protein [Colletotrichum musicola]|uniref:Het domain-containing protein n=1 Tax=Colletotrichum musicola TaxID=2175873 RepID=A0A8H6JHF7_9PEZI|nr:het domain-containing protein [Colletotrichum musicola]
MQKYVYKPITNQGFIRILTLSPGAPGDDLRGELGILNTGICPDEYEAISYVWGNSSRSRVILCGGAKILITENLHEALSRLRLTQTPRRLWVDQICIDQDNPEEKSKQIPLMDLIYRNAAHVLVWLGCDLEGVASAAFRLVADVAAIFSDGGRRAKFNREYSDNLSSRLELNESWSPLRALAGLPWFSRVWVVQEIGANAPATLFWGDAFIEWEILHSVSKALADYHHLRKYLDLRSSNIKYMYRRFIEPDRSSRHANRFSFIYELHRARHLLASDARDRVYAMLGHYSIRNGHNHLLRALKPDYTKVLEDVYTDVATRSLMGDDGTLLTLASVQHDSLPNTCGRLRESFANREYSSTISPNNLPSWVPDWRVYQSHIFSEPTSPHHASGRLSPALHVDQVSKTLHVRGFFVDTVAACSEPFGQGEFGVGESNWSTALGDIWADVCGHSKFDTQAKYLPSIPNASGSDQECQGRLRQQEQLASPAFAFMQTLSNACVAVAWHDGQSYDAIPKLQWFAHGAAYLVKAMKSCSTSKTVRDLAEKGDAAKWARAANGATRSRVFARTRKGYFVLGPKVMEPGDIICVLRGGVIPFCLRPWGSKFLLVGECYAHGVMEGEMVTMAGRQEIEEQVFDVL